MRQKDMRQKNIKTFQQAANYIQVSWFPRQQTNHKVILLLNLYELTDQGQLHKTLYSDTEQQLT